MKKIVIPPVFLLISVVLIVMFYFVLPEFNKIPFPYNFGGLAVAFCGFMLMGKCRDLFKKHDTTLKFEKSSSLVTEGVFRWTRNPMYLGMFLLLLGIAICFMNLFSIAVAFGFIALIQILFIPQEERWMSDTFGEQYSEYRRKVRRWI